MQAVSSFLQRLGSGLYKLGRRCEPRFEVEGFVHVYEHCRDGVLLGTGSLRNVSASGVCISMQQRLALGDRVHLAGPGLGVNAIVRHAALGTSAYVIGLEIVGLESAVYTEAGLPATW